ncbi:MAG: hypothetical protein IJO63_03175 [Bacilli bacterium]|nr:hypothetical protein [Bacilli bacterium]
MNLYKDLGITSVGEFKSFLKEHKAEVKEAFFDKYSQSTEKLTNSLVVGTVLSGVGGFISMFAYLFAVEHNIPVIDAYLLIATYGLVGTVCVTTMAGSAIALVNSLRANGHYKRLLHLVEAYENNPECFVQDSTAMDMVDVRSFNPENTITR